MEYYVAVDQGGSKTDALVFTRDGEIRGSGDDRGLRRPGESYPVLQGTWLRSAVQRALDQAGLPLEGLSSACCALNGADWPEDYVRLQALVSRELSLPLDRVRIVNDCIGALRGGSDSGNRAVLCLGSGANISVQAADGREVIFGYFVTALDQGAGAIGTRGWQAILDAHNGFRPPTLLLPLLLEKYDRPDLVTLFTDITSNRIPFRNHDVSVLVMKAAKAGDAVSLEILQTLTTRLVQYVELGARQLHLEHERITLVLTGGVFKGDGDLLFSLIEQEVARKQLDLVCVSARLEPVAGTALLILDTLPEPLGSAARRRFEADTPAYNLVRP